VKLSIDEEKVGVNREEERSPLCKEEEFIKVWRGTTGKLK